jgi:hypothetical protein
MTDILNTVETWERAERENDSAALESVLTEDFAGIGPRGFKLDKKQWMARYNDGGYRNTAFSWDEVEVREYVDARIVRGVQSNRGVYQGQETGGRFRGTQVYVREDGAWKLAAMQLSEMMEPPGGGATR